MFSSSDRLIDTFSAGQRDVLERIASGAPLAELLERIVRLVEQQAGGMVCSILLLDREKRCVRHGAAPSLPEEYNRAIDGLEIGPEVGSCGAAAHRRERIIVEDIASHPYWAAYKDLALKHDLRACWSTPIFSPTREVLGTFAMYHRHPHAPSPDEITWVDEATHLAAVALCREAADRALQESEARYRQMMATAYEGIWRVDTNARVTFANQRMADMLGYPPEEIVGRTMFDFMDESNRSVAREMLARRWQGISEQYEFRFIRKDGADLWAIVAASPDRDERGEIVGSLGMITDISRRKAAEAALRRSEAEFRAIFESAGLGVALVDTGGRLQKCNPALEQMLGYTNAELCTKTIAELTHPEDLDLSNFRELIAGSRDSYRYEKRYLHRHGHMVRVRITASAMREADGRLRFIMGLIEDVTQRHQAEEERARLEAQLRQSQKMESLGTLAGGIAHDFNNILTAIGGNTQLAMADLPADHPALLSLVEIDRASDRAAALVRQILAFSRPRESNRKVIKLQTVVEEALGLLRASLPATIALHTEFAAETPAIAADSTQIHQVIMNLGANAAHALGDRGGQLAFCLGAVTVEAAAAADFPTLRDGCYARLTVRDNGCGMDPSTLERVFEPFFTTKQPGQGTGLGLAMVHGIIKGHGGAITVESEPERGTTFRIYFPAVEGSSAEPTVEPPAALCGHGEHVLYVDDEETLILLARRGLARLGYRVTTFTDARVALQYFRIHPDDFDVVLTDLAMPGLAGLDLAAEILRLRPELPIILTTGFLRPQDTELAQRLGVRDILPKPASLVALAQSLQRALQSR